jgi:hypothetical protein
MPARNVYHDAVVDALTADGWTITADPHRLFIGRRRLYVDLGAERAAIGVEKDGQSIAVEVQSFLSNSDIENLERAIGQYVLYRLLLAQLDPARTLYLAVPDEVYTGILSEEVGQLVVRELPMRLLVFDPLARRVIRWIS